MNAVDLVILPKVDTTVMSIMYSRTNTIKEKWSGVVMGLSNSAIPTPDVPPELIVVFLADVPQYDDGILYHQPVRRVNLLTWTQAQSAAEKGPQVQPKPYACQMFDQVYSDKLDSAADGPSLKCVTIALLVDAIVKKYPKAGERITSFLGKRDP